MKLIQEYIKELLFEQDCVVIPDFGGFVANYQQSKLDKDVALPGRKWFAFNELLRTDDGLLLTYIIHKEQLSILEASNKIKKFVAYIRKQMVEDDYFYLKGVGSFCYNEENKIQFVPVYNANFLVHNFGLSAIKVHKIERSRVVERPDISFTFTQEPLWKGEGSPFLIQETYPKRTIYQYYSIASIVAIIAFFLSFYLYDNKQFTLSNLNVFANIENNVYTSLNTASTTFKTRKISLIDNLKIRNQVAQHQSTYFVIVGSFDNKKNAQHLMGTLKKEGYVDAKLISNDKGEKIKVSLTNFSTRGEAIKKASSLEKAWIYTSELLP